MRDSGWSCRARFPRVLVAPVPVDGCHHFIESFRAGKFLGERVARKMLHVKAPRMAKWLKQARPDQWRDVMRGNAQRFGHFLLGQEDGKFPQCR